MWASTVWTAGQFLSLIIDSTCHDVAASGCSWRKHLPFLSCSMYSFLQKSKCFSPRARACITFSLPSGVLIFKFWICQKGVHSGDPTSMYGFTVLTKFRARFRHSCFFSSQT